MFINTVTYQRPLSIIPFFTNSSAEAKAMVEQFNAAIMTAPGYISKTTTWSVDKNTLTLVHKWVDEASFEAFKAANNQMISALSEARIPYQLGHGITRDSVKSNV